METYREMDPTFVDKFLSSIYVDDVVSGSKDVESTYELYVKSKLRLAAASFKLRKFVTNSDELRHHIHQNESPPEDEFEVAKRGRKPSSEDSKMGEGRDPLPDDQEVKGPLHIEEDQSFAKCSLGDKVSEVQGVHKILGVQWDFTKDEFQFDIGDVTCTMESAEPTKRSVISVAAIFFNPLGVVSPVTILFKMFCQHLCKAKVG